MNDDTVKLGTHPNEETPARGKKAPRKRERHDYAKELHALEGRVATAIRLLKKMPTLGGESNPLLAVALEILEGE